MSDIAPLLELISTASSRRELWALIIDYFVAQGGKMISYHGVNPDASSIAIATYGFPEDWVTTYRDENFVEIDPIPELASKLARPFYWHEIRDLVTLTVDNKRYLDAMARANLGDGLAFYVFGPVLQNAYVGLGFGVDHLDLDPAKVFEYQCVAQAGHLRVCALSSAPENTALLTEREREVLKWVSRGKSNSVIADILTVSPHTIDAHIRSIYRKLDVSDRTRAAIRGLGNGILPYQG